MNEPTNHHFIADREFLSWLRRHRISLACTTYQTSRLMLLGVASEHEGRFWANERYFNRAMGLYVDGDRIYLSSSYQIWQLHNTLAPGQDYQGSDKLYVPRIGYTMGNLEIRDIAIDATGQIVFASSLLNCLATTSDRYNCRPLWQPAFISKIVNEDRCHLNGLAMVAGQPRYVTAVSRSDVIDGWRDRRADGGVAIDIVSNEIVATGLSMPHSPRWYGERLWLLNSGRGEIGYIDLKTGKFEAVAFCPGYLRGLAFWDNYAIVGLSKPRSDDGTFAGLPLDELLAAKEAEPRCGLMVIDLTTGAIVHWLRFEGIVSELYDVQVLPNVSRPMALGFQTDEIARLIAIAPSDANALLEQSRFFKQQGNVAEAEACLREAIRLKPDFWGAYNNLGTILQNRGAIAEAKQCYDLALQYNPDFPEAIANRASIWQLEEDRDRAKDGYDRALQLNPDYVPARFNLANLLKQQQKLTEAAEQFQQVVALEPNYAAAWYELGQIWEYWGDLERAFSCYDRVRQIDANASYVEWALAMVKRRLCDWRDEERQRQRLELCLQETTFAGFNPFFLNVFPFPLDVHRNVAIAYARKISESVKTIAARLAFTHAKNQPTKLRLGYLSPDFREHAVGWLICQLFAHHDRSRFEVYCYTTTSNCDRVTELVRSGCDDFVDLTNLSTAAAAQRIYDDNIHILIDLAGYTIGNAASVLALQPAPIQVQYLGYPDTMGAEFIQYAIGDRWLFSPDVAAAYTEKIVYLPHAFVASPQEIASSAMSRSQFGLPDDAFVFCCFNSHYKIDAEVFDVWMRILQQVPNAILWLSDGGDLIQQNLQREARDRGVNPSRLHFAPKLPHAEYLARYALADLYLDTFIYNAGSTATAALWAGLPTIVRIGQTYASRMGASICTAAGMESLICNTNDDYERLAIELARSPSRLSELRQVLQQPLPLFDLKRYVRYLEAACDRIWQQWVDG